LYIPDYVANAGGLVSVVDELTGNYNEERVRSDVEAIYKTVSHIIEISMSEKRPTSEVADELAEKRFLKQI
jgi:leucine dehydrogenase